MVAANIKKVIEDDGSIHYYLGDLHHNPEGPAVIAYDGLYKEYWYKGMSHRIEEPAIQYADGDYEYFEQGRRHNLQGPAKRIHAKILQVSTSEVYGDPEVTSSNIRLLALYRGH